MCSTPEPSLDDLTRAIDDLAAASRAGAAPGQLNELIARLWGMMADLDPELARRLSRYQRPADGQASPAGATGLAAPTDPAAPTRPAGAAGPVDPTGADR